MPRNELIDRKIKEVTCTEYAKFELHQIAETIFLEHKAMLKKYRIYAPSLALAIDYIIYRLLYHSRNETVKKRLEKNMYVQLLEAEKGDGKNGMERTS